MWTNIKKCLKIFFLNFQDTSVCDAAVIQSTVGMTFNKPDYVKPFVLSEQVKRNSRVCFNLIKNEGLNY